MADSGPWYFVLTLYHGSKLKTTTSLLPRQQSWQESFRSALVASPTAMITVAGVVVITDAGGSGRKIRFLHHDGPELPLFHHQGNK